MRETLNTSRRVLGSRFFASVVAASLLGAGVAACEPKVVVAECPKPEGGSPANADEAVVVPWTTSFENDFCDYYRAHGFCYSPGDASNTLVTSPVHTGSSAAAFEVTAGDIVAGQQARCVRQGVFPKQAYYSAYYFVPEPALNTGNWNLFFFQGGEPTAQHELWDVSLQNGANGQLSLYIFDHVRGRIVGAGETPPIPIGEWFQIGVYLRRAADETGEIALYQDGALVLRLTDLSTDDTRWGQWYVGNLASALTPPASTLYVDDVAIRESP